MVRRPRLHLGMSVLSVIGSVAFLAANVLALLRVGYAKPSLVLVLVFWIFCLCGGLSVLRRALRSLRDPEGEATRVDERRERLLSVPPQELRRSVLRTLAVLSAVPLVAGVLTVLTARDHADRVFGWVLVGFAVLVVYVGAFVLRHPRLRSADVAGAGDHEHDGGRAEG